MGFSLEQVWHCFILSWPLMYWSYFQFYGTADCSVAAGICPQNPSNTKNSCYSITSFRILLQIVPTAEIQHLKFSLRPQRPRLSLAVDIFAVKFTYSLLLCYFHYSLMPALCHFQKSSFTYTALRWELHPQPAQVELQETRTGWAHQDSNAQSGALSHSHTDLHHITTS